MSKPLYCAIALIWPLLSMGSAAAIAAGPAGKVRFNAQIRPILSNSCFFCHGPDEKHRKADLRLDQREGALSDLGGYAAIVPGKPDKSVLLERVLSHDADEQMPPPKSKKPRLNAAEVELLKRWIEQGAEYEGHWAFAPLSQAAPPSGSLEFIPKTANSAAKPGAASNPIDRFIGARLEAEKIVPSAEADRATLMRRVSLDLTGLLPSPDEVNAFVKDPLPDAYERLVDKLLANPHYGERWGRHWLDQARYADSNGYSIDSQRAMWPYRDWVIKAVNDDMPFDRFTIEQLAGDLLPNHSKSQLIATGFHRNTLINEEGGTNKEQFRVETVIDRTNTTGAVWLGLTVGCAQCHSHKFDPISHREYYELYGFFNQGKDENNNGPTVDVARGEIFGQQPAAGVLSNQLAAKESAARAAWEKQELTKTKAGGATKWLPAHYVEYDTATGAGFELLEDNSLLADGKGAFNDTYRVVATSALPKIAAVRLRVLTHKSLPKGGPGLAPNGNFVLTDFRVKVGGKEQVIRTAAADHQQPKFPAAAAIDNDPASGWAINVDKASIAKLNADHEVVFVFSNPVESHGLPLEITLSHNLNENYLIGRYALEFSATAPVGDAGNAFQVALQSAPATRTAAQNRLLQDAFERVDPASVAAKKTAAENIAQLMVMGDVASPRPTYIHLRGDYLRPDEKTGLLQPGVLRAVPPALEPATNPRTRLTLARWLVDSQNPLTPRVTVNRIWMRFFARGIVETDDDFGSQGALPTHPELLDWLAGELIRGKWSLKAINRLIVTSATYRQSSQARPDLAEKDPRNLLLARQERIRLEAEIIRDSALCASGLLTDSIGGPPVYPPQPAGVYSFTQNAKKWPESKGPDRFRRALYIQFYRSAPYPLFTTFDAPNFQTVCTRRARSNTPLQSLTTANDEAFLEIAQGLAARVVREVSGSGAGTVESRIKRAFFLGLCREPSAKELAILRGYYLQQAALFSADTAAAVALAPSGFIGTAAPDAAAMVCAARAILNSDAFITRE